MTPELLFNYVFNFCGAVFLATGFGIVFIRLVVWICDVVFGK